MNDPTPEEVRASVVADSTQINAAELLSPMTVTIKAVTKGTREQPINIALMETDKFFRPCKTCRRILISQYSDDPKKWIGQRLTLYNDETVLWAGVAIGGVRISHLTGLDKPKTFIVTVGRGKRSEVTIHPLTMSATEQAYIADAREEMAQAETMETLKAIGFILKEKSAAVQDALRPVYAARKKELEG